MEVVTRLKSSTSVMDLALAFIRLQFPIMILEDNSISVEKFFTAHDLCGTLWYHSS